MQPAPRWQCHECTRGSLNNSASLIQTLNMHDNDNDHEDVGDYADANVTNQRNQLVRRLMSRM